MALGGTFGNAVTIYPDKLAEVLKGPQGPVYRDLMVKGNRVLNRARIEAPRSQAGPAVPNQYRRGKRRQPGDLARGQVMRVGTFGGQPAVFVGTQDPVGLYVHEGTQAHLILPRSGKRLVFFWPKAGRVVYLKQVHHPGNRPNRWLLRSLVAING